MNFIVIQWNLIEPLTDVGRKSYIQTKTVQERIKPNTKRRRIDSYQYRIKEVVKSISAETLLRTDEAQFSTDIPKSGSR